VSFSAGLLLKSSSRLIVKSAIVVPGGLVNVRLADAPLAIVLPPSILRPTSSPLVSQSVSTTMPATAGPVHEALLKWPPPAAQA
jgi:hypothetical protein